MLFSAWKAKDAIGWFLGLSPLEAVESDDISLCPGEPWLLCLAARFRVEAMTFRAFPQPSIDRRKALGRRRNDDD